MSFADPGGARRLLFLEAASFKPLAILRIGIGLVLLFQAQMFWIYRDIFLAEFGPVPWFIGQSLLDPLVPRLSYVRAWLAPLGATSDGVIAGVLLVHAVAAAFLVAGYRTRIAAAAAWLTYLPLLYTADLFFYGIGGMLLIGVFYCVVLPVGAEWSLDARRLGRAHVAGDLDASLSVAVLRIHLCIVYLAAGLSKAVGAQWWSGDAIWRAVSLPRFQQFDPAPVLALPVLLQAAAIGAVLVQLAYPVLVWTRLRAVVVLLTELLHVGIAIFLGLWLFSIVMVVLNMAAFGESIWVFLQRWRAPSPRVAETT